MKHALVLFAISLAVSILATVFQQRVLVFFDMNTERAGRFFIALYAITGGWLAKVFFLGTNSLFLANLENAIWRAETIEVLERNAILKLFFTSFLRVLKYSWEHDLPGWFLVVGTHVFAVMLFWLRTI